jgi:hypothetical protein
MAKTANVPSAIAPSPIAIGANLGRATERIECDQEGQIRRVQRFYGLKNWSEVTDGTIAYSIVPARALSGLRFETLQELRQRLAAKGVLSRDVPVHCEVLDLTAERAFLGLNQQMLMDAVSRAGTLDLDLQLLDLLPYAGRSGSCRLHCHAQTSGEARALALAQNAAADLLAYAQISRKTKFDPIEGKLNPLPLLP